MFWYGPQLGGWGWAAGLGSLVFWALLAVAVVALIRSFTRGDQRRPPAHQGYATGPGPYGPPGAAPGAGPGHPAPEQILAERFARGEIDEDEFHQRMTVLRAEAPHPGPAGPPY